MNLIELANRASREAAEANPHVALLLVFPEERIELADLMRQHSAINAIHTENFGIDERDCFYVLCQDEDQAQALELAWRSFTRWRRLLPPRG